MVQSVVSRALALMSELKPEELRQVQQALVERIAEEIEKERAFEQALVTAGLLREVKSPPILAEIERPLVEIQGKPLSETIIEERR